MTLVNTLSRLGHFKLFSNLSTKEVLQSHIPMLPESPSDVKMYSLPISF